MEDIQNIVVGDKITLDIRKQGINGEGIGYYNKLAVFVPGAILRESVVAEILDMKPGYAIARLDSIVQESDKRRIPPCPYYEKCGGCQMQHIDYLEQQKIKQSILKQSLKRYTDFDVDRLEIRRNIPMKPNYGYRNKSQMPFKNTNMGLALGLYEANSNKFVIVDSCLVQEPIVNETNQKILKILIEHRVSAFDQMNPEGLLLNLITRYVRSTDSLQVTLITSNFHPILNDVAVEIIAKIPNVKGVFCSVNKQHNVQMFGKKVDLLTGDPYVPEQIGDLTINLSPEAFHQLNTVQMSTLYAEIIKAAVLTGQETVIDAFCGVGITTLQMAKLAKTVYGIDYSAASIKDANANAGLNKIKNAFFFADRVEKILPQLLAKPGKPDVIIVDPPRSGLEDSVLTELLIARIPKIVYVSCNPSTLAKNLDRLCGAYTLDFIQPIDMFPHTSSVESITRLTLK